MSGPGLFGRRVPLPAAAPVATGTGGRGPFGAGSRGRGPLAPGCSSEAGPAAPVGLPARLQWIRPHGRIAGGQAPMVYSSPSERVELFGNGKPLSRPQNWLLTTVPGTTR